MQIDKRKLLGPLFGPLSRAKHSPASRYLVASCHVPSHIYRAWVNKPFFSVELSNRKGMGALLSDVLLICQYAEAKGLVPHVVSKNPLYLSDVGGDFGDDAKNDAKKDAKNDFGKDALSPYFDGLSPAGLGVRVGVGRVKPMRYRTLESFCHLDFSNFLPLPDASRLFAKYLRPKPSITEVVSQVLQRLPNGQFDLAMHFRATDKALEAAVVSYDVFGRAIDEHCARGGLLDDVFLATDDIAFEAYVRRRYSQSQIKSYNLGQPNDVSRGRHFSDLPPQTKAMEALVNMFLLASAPKLIRTASYMSAISKFINPALHTVTLNRTHWGSRSYPEFEIVAEEATR